MTIRQQVEAVHCTASVPRTAPVPRTASVPRTPPRDRESEYGNETVAGCRQAQRRWRVQAHNQAPVSMF